jgi:5,10-methylenetetrahydrofolate reductase
MGLHSDLIGAHALGVRNILALTGDPPSLGDYPNATAVYDVDAIGLVEIISKLNNGTDLAGNSLGSHTGFSIGVAINPRPTISMIAGAEAQDRARAQLRCLRLNLIFLSVSVKQKNTKFNDLGTAAATVVSSCEFLTMKCRA